MDHDLHKRMEAANGRTNACLPWANTGGNTDSLPQTEFGNGLPVRLFHDQLWALLDASKFQAVRLTTYLYVPRGGNIVGSKALFNLDKGPKYWSPRKAARRSVNDIVIDLREQSLSYLKRISFLDLIRTVLDHPTEEIETVQNFTRWHNRLQLQLHWYIRIRHEEIDRYEEIKNVSDCAVADLRTTDAESRSLNSANRSLIRPLRMVWKVPQLVATQATPLSIIFWSNWEHCSGKRTRT